jgi:hypothetical protein
MAMKEMLIKSDFNERQAREAQIELKEIEKRLQESEEHNQNYLVTSLMLRFQHTC